MIKKTAMILIRTVWWTLCIGPWTVDSGLGLEPIETSGVWPCVWESHSLEEGELLIFRSSHCCAEAYLEHYCSSSPTLHVTVRLCQNSLENTGRYYRNKVYSWLAATSSLHNNQGRGVSRGVFLHRLRKSQIYHKVAKYIGTTLLSLVCLAIIVRSLESK